MTRKIVGVFETEQEAAAAVAALVQQGYNAEGISVLSRDRSSSEELAEETGTKAADGAAAGAAAGSALGGVTGLLAGLGLLAIPGLGPILAGGPLAGALAGALFGAGAGGLVGGLAGLGIPEDEAREYESYVNEGKILVLVDEEEAGRRTKVYDAFRDNRAVNAHRFDDVDPRQIGASAQIGTGDFKADGYTHK
ncbi:general stress protein [Paenibacillus pinistramenti]|uniref:general stress protein n=1 Tax=Paenibacillus pinistramenti TaxID=1768003 RepID=UPI001109AEF4|nr:general stress protein [Paenibacillus pinistramenti]